MASEHARAVEDATRGDAHAIGWLIERHLPGVLAYVRANAGGLLAREESFDLVQSACREVLADLPRHDYRDEVGFRRWLYLAAERKIVDRARYHGREKRGGGRDALALSDLELDHLTRGYADLATPSRHAAGVEAVAALEAALAKLSEEQRRVVVLSKVVGLPHAEIAAELGKSEVAVRSLLHRALARLAVELGQTAGQ